VKTRVIAHNQQVVRFDREVRSEISRTTYSTIIEYVKACLPKVKGIIISDYCKGLITRKLVKNIIDLAGPKRFVTADPKIGHFNYYKGINLITPNINEASFGSGIDITDESTLLEAGKILLDKLQCSTVMITRGDEGMTLFEKSGKVRHIPTFAREVYDVSGAGDTVIAALSLSRAAGATLLDAANIANHAAGIVVGKMGTAVATKKELLQSIKTSRPV
jgi:D-beta-D-heptose 7-phosphate kinase/D-beta-D-heptose 1-phosphate adenosyltransferase